VVLVDLLVVEILEMLEILEVVDLEVLLETLAAVEPLGIPCRSPLVAAPGHLFLALTS
jgi:hypothetical protein